MDKISHKNKDGMQLFILTLTSVGLGHGWVIALQQNGSMWFAIHVLISDNTYL